MCWLHIAIHESYYEISGKTVIHGLKIHFYVSKSKLNFN